jgi:hypothetical protein
VRVHDVRRVLDEVVVVVVARALGAGHLAYCTAATADASATTACHRRRRRRHRVLVDVAYPLCARTLQLPACMRLQLSRVTRMNSGGAGTPKRKSLKGMTRLTFTTKDQGAAVWSSFANEACGEAVRGSRVGVGGAGEEGVHDTGERLLVLF